MTSKEMMIVFVFDLETIDDVTKSLLYFYPQWVPDEQKYCVAGQVVGTTQCLKRLFGCPKVISLQSGKFVICNTGRFIIAVGTDRNVPDWVLENRMEVLNKLLAFFHSDLNYMMEQQGDKEKFVVKLYYMFETYLKILMYSGNSFNNIYTIQLPKSANDVFLEAIQILECCQELDYVLGGSMFYNNKIVVTQLNTELTKILVLSDLYRMRSSADNFEVDFPLPFGVQLLQVYINEADYENLVEDSTKYRTVFQYLNKANSRRDSKNFSSKEAVKTALKRDQSIIFSTVPEEDSEQHSPVNIENTSYNVKVLNRPKFLNLLSKTSDKVERSETKTTTPFYGSTSVCSTPLTDLNKVVYEKALSICVNNDGGLESNLDENNISRFNISESNCSEGYISKSSCAKDESNKNESYKDERYKDERYKDVTCKDDNFKDESSLNDEFLRSLTSNSKFLQENIPKNSSKGNLFQNILNERPNYAYKDLLLNKSLNKKDSPNGMNNDINTNLRRSFSSCDMNIFEKANCVKKTKTINDPCFPVFRPDGTIISQNLYTEILKQLKIDSPKKDVNKPKFEEREPVENLDKTQENVEILLISKVPEETVKSQRSRKSLSLPLKSLSGDNDFASPVTFSKYLGGGVQLTPLISKLNILAQEDRSSGFCNRVGTPCDFKESIYTPLGSLQSKIKERKQLKKNKKKKSSDGKLHRVVLFICGQDTTVLLLIGEDGCRKPEIINKLWDICTMNLGTIERQLRQCLDVHSASSNSGDTYEPYSYLFLDPRGDTMERSGPWNSIELGSVAQLHRDFKTSRNLMEITVRGNETVIYGHHCGNAEVFYHQSVNTNGGLPAPGDTMGVIPIKAKRRLERDHSIILL